jgi:uncharacterized protein (DUF302 family)
MICSEGLRMLQVKSEHKLEDVEAILRRAAQNHEASILAVSHLGNLLRDHQPKSSLDVVSFTICQPDLYAALLAADVRFAALLPCRIAVSSTPSGALMESISPKDFCRLINRPDLERLAAPLEAALKGMMEDTARMTVSAVRAGAGDRSAGLGATEGQMSARGTLPQRIDCHGSKVEDMAGTGKNEAQGG